MRIQENALSRDEFFDKVIVYGERYRRLGGPLVLGELQRLPNTRSGRNADVHRGFP